MSDLYDAVKSNDVSKIEELVKQGRVSLSEVVNPKCAFPLHASAKFNDGDSHHEIIQFLLENGADSNSVDPNGKTPVQYLMERNCNARTLELFLKFLPDLSKLSKTEQGSLLSTVIRLNSVKALRRLLDLGLDVKSHAGALHLAAKENVGESHYEVIEMLLNKGADVNARDERNRTPFFLMVETANLKVFELFLSFEPDVEAVDESGCNALIPASHNKNNPKVLEQLIISLKLNVNHRDQRK